MKEDNISKIKQYLESGHEANTSLAFQIGMNTLGLSQEEIAGYNFEIQAPSMKGAFNRRDRIHVPRTTIKLREYVFKGKDGVKDKIHKCVDLVYPIQWFLNSFYNPLCSLHQSFLWFLQTR